jgi:hypothetical protein
MRIDNTTDANPSSKTPMEIEEEAEAKELTGQ